MLKYVLITSGETFQINGRSLDVWSLGVTLYCFVHGHCPFEVDDDNIFELQRKIMHDPIVYSENISEELRDLFEKILNRDPDLRITISEIKQHPWTTSHGAWPMDTTEENCRILSSGQPSSASFKPVIKFVSKVILSYHRWSARLKGG
jgi:serine/threonine protein kinase